MSEIYDATYAAIRSKVSGANFDQAVEAAIASAGLGNAIESVRSQFADMIAQYERPSIMLRPEIFMEGNLYCASYGDMPEGVQGFGETPQAAMLDFDKEFHTRPPRRLEVQRD